MDLGEYISFDHKLKFAAGMFCKEVPDRRLIMDVHVRHPEDFVDVVQYAHLDIILSEPIAYSIGFIFVFGCGLSQNNDYSFAYRRDDVRHVASRARLHKSTFCLVEIDHPSFNQRKHPLQAVTHLANLKTWQTCTYLQ